MHCIKPMLGNMKYNYEKYAKREWLISINDNGSD